MRIPPFVAPSLAVLSLPLLSGCTVIGAGLGASLKGYEPVAPENAQSIPVGTDAEFHASSDPHGYSRTTIAGQMVAVEDGHVFVVSDDNRMRDVRIDHIHQLQAKTASYWVAGLLTGLAIDVVVTILAVEAWQSSMSHLSLGPGPLGP